MKIRVKVDLASGVFFTAATAALVLAIPKQVPVLSENRLNSRTFPYAIVLVLMAMSIRLVVADVVKLLRRQPVREAEFDLGDEWRALLLFFLLIAYVALIPLIGSLAASLLMGIGFLIYFRTTQWIRYVIVIVSCLFVYWVFRIALGVQLP